MKVLGMGNALVDIMTRLKDDEILKEFSLPKGSMQLVDREMISVVIKGTEALDKMQSSGGSAANTIHGLANLGIDTGFIGKIGDDDFGRFFQSDLADNNIQPHLIYGMDETGRAIALISPDSERTFTTFLGAAVELSAEDIKNTLFEGYSYFYIEGYLVQNHALLKRALSLARANHLKISLDLASFNVVEANLEFLKSIVADFVDIVFANEEEAKAFTGKDPEGALNILGELCDIAIVKVGKEGSYIKQSNETYKVGVIPVNSIDTTGAGDLYAAGFIYGLIKGLPLNKCGEIGSLLAGNVIEVIGAKMDNDSWDEIRRRVQIGH